MYIHTYVYAGADPGFDQGGAPDRDRPKTAILGPQFCRILVLGPHFWWSGGGGPPGPPLDPPLICIHVCIYIYVYICPVLAKCVSKFVTA